MAYFDDTLRYYMNFKTRQVYWNYAIDELSDDEFEELIKKGVDINPSTGTPPICKAILSGEDTKFSILLSHGANPFIRNNLPLVHAIMTNNINITRQLLDSGAKIANTSPTRRICDNRYDGYLDVYHQHTQNYENYQGYIVFYVIRNGLVEMLKLLIEYHTDMTYDNYLPIRSCASYKDTEVRVIIKMLIEYQQPPQDILQKIYIESVYCHNFDVAQCVQPHINCDDKLVKHILRSDTWRLSNKIVTYCLNNFDCTVAISELGEYLGIIRLCDHDCLDVVNRILKLGVDLTPHADNFIIEALYLGKHDIIKFVSEHCDIFVVTQKITEKILELAKKSV